jgi:predicted HTH domain antitoxin
MVIISDEFIKEKGLSEKQFKIELAVMMYEKQMMNLTQAAELAGISDLEMQHELGNKNIPIRWEEEFSRKKGIRKAGQLKGFVTYMAEDFDAPLEDFKDYMS